MGQHTHPCDAFPPASLLLLLPNHYDALVQRLTRRQPELVRAIGETLSGLWARALRAERERDRALREVADLDSAVEIALRRFEDRLPWHARRTTQRALRALRSDLRGVFTGAPERALSA